MLQLFGHYFVIVSAKKPNIDIKIPEQILRLITGALLFVTNLSLQKRRIQIKPLSNNLAINLKYNQSNARRLNQTHL